MKILVNDFCGHAFTLQLAVELAQRGHDVDYVYFASEPGTKGNFERAQSISKTIRIHGPTIDGVTDLAKSSLFALDHRHRAITYNFAYRERLTITAIVEAFCKVGGFGRPVLTLLGWLLAVAALPFDALNSVGLRNPIHRRPLKKLYESTNIVPAWLEKNEFEYGTTLETTLREWRDESADGRFI